MAILNNCQLLPIHRGENRSCRGCSWGKQQAKELCESKLSSRVTPKVIKVSAICFGRSVRNLFSTKKEASIQVEYCLMALCKTPGCQGFHDALGYATYTRCKPHPHGNGAVVCARVGYLPPWEYYQQIWGWGCAHEPLINSHDEITVLILEVPPPPESHNWFDIQSSDANIKQWRDALPGSWPGRLLMPLAGAQHFKKKKTIPVLVPWYQHFG